MSSLFITPSKMRFRRLSAWALTLFEITFLRSGYVFATRDLRARPSPLYLRGLRGLKATTTTTTTSDFGSDYLLVSSTTARSVFSYNFKSHQSSVLIPNAGSNPTGIALDHNQGYIYYTDPGSQQIVRYELSISNEQVVLYDLQPVPIAQGVNADWILVNDYGNIIWTDAADHSIKKMYRATIDLVASGAIQPDQLQVVSYMDVYTSLGRIVPSACYNRKVWPSNCTANVTCNACQSLSLQPYIYQLYSNVGIPSGLQLVPGNKLLWGNLVDGYTRGSVVEAEAEPALAANASTFPKFKALTHLWDSVFDFWQMQGNEIGGNNLFLTTNGTLGVPPIPGDVVGALVAITTGDSSGSQGVREAVPVDWNFVRPRALTSNGQGDLYVADDWGVRELGAGRIMEKAPETRLLALPGSAGLVMVKTSDPCYPVMVQRGSQPLPPEWG